MEKEQFSMTEYVYFHDMTGELLTLFCAPEKGLEHLPYDLVVAGNTALMGLIYIGEL